MSSQVCDKLSDRPWQKYDTSSVPKIPGIYAIGEKKVGSKKIEYMYVGRSEDMKRRLQQHKGPTPQQDIDQRMARKFKQQKESELRIKYVSEKQQKTKEGAYIDCLTKKIGHRPVKNKRSGDGCASCAVGHKQSTRNKVQKTGFRMKSPSKTSTIRPVTSRSKWQPLALQHGHPVALKCDLQSKCLLLDLRVGPEWGPLVVLKCDQESELHLGHLVGGEGDRRFLIGHAL